MFRHLRARSDKPATELAGDVAATSTSRAAPHDIHIDDEDTAFARIRRTPCGSSNPAKILERDPGDDPLSLPQGSAIGGP